VLERRFGTLSTIEKRRLGIAIELLGYPSLLLVDDSAEPLAPFDEVQISILLRELSRQGITIIYVNPRSRSAGLSDKIIYLAPGGTLVWFGL
jgi:ABC-type multidrug transport system ATPase subunit